MRISHVITSLATGGAETLVVNLSLKLRQLGHEVEIVTLSDADGVPRRVAAAAGITVRDLGHDPRDPCGVVRLRRAVENADIVHAHLFPTLYTAAVARIRRPRVYTEHSTHNRRRTKVALHPVERAAYRRYRSIVAISDGVGVGIEQYLMRLGVATPITVIPNGIADAFFDRQHVRRRHADGRLRLIAVGTLDDRKNFAAAVAAVATAPGTVLDIVGSGPLESELREQIDRLCVADRVRLLGRRDDVAELMDGRDALLSTSRYEGFGLVAAEAMARGLPVIGPDVAGLRDVVSDGETGYLYPPNAEPGHIASVIARLVDPGGYERLSRNAIVGSGRFSMERAARAHLRLYSTLCSADPA